MEDNTAIKKTQIPGWKGLALPALIILILGLALTLPGLGKSGLWDPWEPKYAQTPREMAATGDWIMPVYREGPRLVKPPLTYWMIGAAQAVLGVNETAARLPSALLAVLCPLALALAFAVRRQPLLGVLAGAALLTSPQWLLLGRFATPDMPFASVLGVLLAIAIALPVVESQRGRLCLQLLAVLLIVAATLIEWPRGLLIPAWAVVGWGAIALRRRGVMGLALVAGLYYAGQHLYSPVLNIASFVLVVCLALAMLRVRAGLSLRRLGVGVLLVILLAAPWFVAVYQQAPQETSKRLFGYKHAINLGETMEEFTGPSYYILLIVGVGALPWAPAALAGLARAFRRRESDQTAIIVAGAWIGILLFYTLSEAQMGHFYGVLQPSLACLAAVGLYGLTRSRPRAVMPVVSVAIVLWLVVRVEPSVLLETANVFSRLHQAVEPLAWVSGSMLAWLVLVVLSCLLRRRMLAVASVLPALVLVVYLTQGLVPELERFKTTRLMWDAYVELRHPGEPIGAAAQALNTSFYYSNNSIVRLKRTEQVEAFLRGPGDKFIILPRDVFLSSFDRFLAPGARWEPIVDSHPRHILVRYTLDQGPSPPGPTPVTR